MSGWSIWWLVCLCWFFLFPCILMLHIYDEWSATVLLDWPRSELSTKLCLSHKKRNELAFTRTSVNLNTLIYMYVRTNLSNNKVMHTREEGSQIELDVEGHHETLARIWCHGTCQYVITQLLSLLHMSCAIDELDMSCTNVAMPGTVADRSL